MVKPIDIKNFQDKGIAVRTVKFNFPLYGKEFTVLASANPSYLGTEDEAESYVKKFFEAGYRHYISMENSPAINSMESKVEGIKRYNLDTDDYKPPQEYSFINIFIGYDAYSDEYYESVFGEPRNETASKDYNLGLINNLKNDEGIFLHCGAGHGRSGTVLAALKIMEKIQHAAQKDNNYLDNFKTKLETNPKESIYLYKKAGEVLAPKLVADAIKEIRVMNLRDKGEEKRDDSCENEEQLKFLSDFAINYADILKLNMTLIKDHAKQKTDNKENALTNTNVQDTEMKIESNTKVQSRAQFRKKLINKALDKQSFQDEDWQHFIKKCSEYIDDTNFLHNVNIDKQIHRIDILGNFQNLDTKDALEYAVAFVIKGIATPSSNKDEKFGTSDGMTKFIKAVNSGQFHETINDAINNLVENQKEAVNQEDFTQAKEKITEKSNAVLDNNGLDNFIEKVFRG